MVSFDKLKLANDSAWVTCEGETLPVYGVETVASNKVTGWIPSQAGKPFIVHYNTALDNNRSPVVCNVHVDGSYVRGKIARGRKDSTGCFLGPRVGEASEQTMRFATIRTVDDESQTLAAESLSSLGSISVDFARCELLDRAAWSPSEQGLRDALTLHETQKKLGGHHVALGEERKDMKTPSSRYRVNLIDDPPRSIFEFRYRPADILRAQGIMPPAAAATSPAINDSSSPSRKRTHDDSSSTSRDPRRNKRLKQEDDQDYQRRLEARVRALEHALPKGHPELKNSVLIKKESGASRDVKMCEVIDLTDD